MSQPIRKGSTVVDPDGSEWLVSDPDTTMKGEPFIWLGSPDSDAQRGIGKDTFESDDWEVVN